MVAIRQHKFGGHFLWLPQSVLSALPHVIRVFCGNLDRSAYLTVIQRPAYLFAFHQTLNFLTIRTLSYSSFCFQQPAVLAWNGCSVCLNKVECPNTSHFLWTFQARWNLVPDLISYHPPLCSLCGSHTGFLPFLDCPGLCVLCAWKALPREPIDSACSLIAFKYLLKETAFPGQPFENRPRSASHFPAPLFFIMVPTRHVIYLINLILPTRTQVSGE